MTIRYGLWRRSDFWSKEPIPLEVTLLVKGKVADEGECWVEVGWLVGWLVGWF